MKKEGQRSASDSELDPAHLCRVRIDVVCVLVLHTPLGLSIAATLYRPVRPTWPDTEGQV